MSTRPPRHRRAMSGATLARPFGIELQIHPSWVISILVLTYYAYYDIAPHVVRGTANVIPRLLVAVLFGAVIAACIVVHELSHSLVARAYGLPVRRITLFAFGGVSQIEKEAPSPRAEFSIALAGPLASVLIACVLGGIGRALEPSASGLVGAWGRLGVINMYLAIFNLVPAFPMDGGRLLRSGLWTFVSRARATRWAVRVGQSFAVLAMGGGALLLIGQPSDGSIGALWIILIGLFIYSAASAAGRLEGGERPNEDRDGAALVPGVQMTERREDPR
ncbi:MAG: site-2 protease family protein [Actinomycetota bacterium]